MTYLLERLQGEAAREDGEAAEEALLGRVQQVVAPGDGGAEGSLAVGKIGAILAEILPPQADNPNELPDRVVEL